MSEEVERFETEKSKAAVIFIAGFTGLLGLIGIVAFLNKLPYIGPDEIFMLVLAAAMITFTVLFLRYSFNPPLILTKREMVIRNFIGTRSFRYEEMVSLGTFSKTFRPRTSNGKNMNIILTTYHLVIETRDGKKKTYTLPSFGRNQRLLSSLQKHSGLTIEKLPDEVEKGLTPPS